MGVEAGKGIYLQKVWHSIGRYPEIDPGKITAAKNIEDAKTGLGDHLQGSRFESGRALVFHEILPVTLHLN